MYANPTRLPFISMVLARAAKGIRLMRKGYGFPTKPAINRNSADQRDDKGRRGGSWPKENGVANPDGATGTKGHPAEEVEGGPP